MRLGILTFGILLALSGVTNASDDILRWKTKAALPTPVDSGAIESIDGIIYVVGGFNTHLPNGTNALSSVYAYDPTTNSWTTIASLPRPRYDGNGAAVINSQLYVAGGWTQVNPPLPHNDLFVYDPPTNTWTSKASIPHLSGCGASGAIRGMLYLYTPCAGVSAFTNLFDVYDPANDSWTSLPAPNVAHSQPAFGVINDKFYIAGGQDENGSEVTNVLEVYDPLTNAWTELAPMPTAVYLPASAALNGELYVIGGAGSGQSFERITQAYNPHTNTWRVLSPELPSPLALAAATVTYGIIFLEGGRSSKSSVGSVATNQDLALPPSIP